LLLAAAERQTCLFFLVWRLAMICFAPPFFGSCGVADAKMYGSHPTTPKYSAAMVMSQQLCHSIALTGDMRLSGGATYDILSTVGSLEIKANHLEGT
jgi:hypothetical protein